MRPTRAFCAARDTVGIGSGFSGRVRVGFGLTISIYFRLISGSFFVHHEMFYESVWKKYENLLLSAFRDIQLNDDPNRHYCCHRPCIYIVCAFRNLVTRFVCSGYISKRNSLSLTGVDWCHCHYCCVSIGIIVHSTVDVHSRRNLEVVVL